MRQILQVSVILIVGALCAGAQNPQQTQSKPAEAPPAVESLPTADHILAAYVDALGGKAAIEKITSRLTKGTFEIPAMGAAGDFENYAKTPNKTILTFTLPGFGIFQQGFDGTVAWAQDPTSGLRELTGVELAAVKLDADFTGKFAEKNSIPR